MPRLSVWTLWCLLAAAASLSAAAPERVRLRDVEVREHAHTMIPRHAHAWEGRQALTFYASKQTTARRTRAVPQVGPVPRTHMRIGQRFPA
jgi:hypothetical protein